MSQIRDSYWRMMKHGKYRAFRNLPVGWALQILHSTDTAERWFRILLELTLYAAILLLIDFFGTLDYQSMIIAFLGLHTITWLLMGNFWVYMLDSFKFVTNTGIDDTLKYISTVARYYERSDSSEAMLVYGSFCRGMFHKRSDLDLRIIRRTDSMIGILAIAIGILVRVYAFLRMIPVDLQVVDSMEFLKCQMRDDEKPVVVYKRQGFDIYNEGVSIEDVYCSPSLVLKETDAK